MNLQIEYVKKEDLKTYANNAKIHTADQVIQEGEETSSDNCDDGAYECECPKCGFKFNRS